MYIPWLNYLFFCPICFRMNDNKKISLVSGCVDTEGFELDILDILGAENVVFILSLIPPGNVR